MKKILIGAACATIVLSFWGCASTPPSAVERVIYDVHTNYVEKVVTSTTVNAETNAAGVVNYQTNTVSNTVSSPEYGLTPKESFVAGVKSGAASVSPITGGIGEIVGAGILLLAGVWGHLRSLNSSKATSVTLAQEVETLRAFIQTLPQGTKYDTAIVSWLQAHQIEAGVTGQVLGLLENKVSNADAKAAVQELKSTIDVLQQQH